MEFLFWCLGHAAGVGLGGARGGQGPNFFEHGHMAYQIDRDYE